MTLLKKTDFPTALLITGLCACGLFHEFMACAAGIIMLIYLAVISVKEKSIRLYFNLCSAAVLAITAGYFISIFYAVDAGAAIIGFARILPVPLYLLILMQKEKQAEDYLKAVPPVACVMAISSAILMQIPILTQWFSVSERLAGFFQYSNTFALFLLAAFIITATKEKLEKTDFIYLVSFVAGILYSGSRTVFILTAVAVAALVLFAKNKKYKIAFISIAAALTLSAVLYAVISGDFDTIGRFLTVSLKESTFVGRFLYYLDALPLILRHPFGTGYLGYYFMEPAIQTGVYSVKSVHNDFLQLMLDVGIIPVILFAAAIIKAFLRKGATLRKRLLLLTITAHCCFDFDLQYIAFFMLFLLLLDYTDGREKEIKTSAAVTGLTATVLSALLLYIGVSQSLSYFRQYELAAKIYPLDTMAQIRILETADNSAETEALADKVLKHNEYAAIAYNKKAQIAYSQGDFEKVIEYKKKASSLAVFSYSTIEEYCYMLINGIYLYSKNNDEYSIKVCQKELINAVKTVEGFNDRLSDLGKMIDDQPKTQLPEDILEYVGRLTDEN